MGQADLYVEVHGDDDEHAQRLADIVGHTVRGIGLATIVDGDTDRWPGGCDRFAMTRAGDVVRLVSTWPDEAEAERVGELVVRWLTANLWAHHGTLGMAWTRARVDGSTSTLHVRQVREAAEAGAVRVAFAAALALALVPVTLALVFVASLAGAIVGTV